MFYVIDEIISQYDCPTETVTSVGIYYGLEGTSKAFIFKFVCAFDFAWSPLAQIVGAHMTPTNLWRNIRYDKNCIHRRVYILFECIHNLMPSVLKMFILIHRVKPNKAAFQLSYDQSMEWNHGCYLLQRKRSTYPMKVFHANCKRCHDGFISRKYADAIGRYIAVISEWCRCFPAIRSDDPSRCT